MPRRTDRRAYRDAPYLDQHARSQARLQEPPRSLAGLLRWFLEGFAAETPERIHADGVWFGRPPREDPETGIPVEDLPPELVGGSQLGAPKEAEPFRQLIENSPRQTAGVAADEHYVRPMRAALHRLSARKDGDAPFMARFLVQVAYAQGDWESVAARWRITPFARRAFVLRALERLHGTYQAQPPNRPLEAKGPSWVDLSESQRAALEEREPRKGVA